MWKGTSKTVKAILLTCAAICIGLVIAGAIMSKGETEDQYWSEIRAAIGRLGRTEWINIYGIETAYREHADAIDKNIVEKKGEEYWNWLNEEKSRKETGKVIMYIGTFFTIIFVPFCAAAYNEKLLLPVIGDIIFALVLFYCVKYGITEGWSDDWTPGILAFSSFVLLCPCIYYTYYTMHKEWLSRNDEQGYERLLSEENRRAREAREHYNSVIEQERHDAELSQKSDVPWEKRYYTFPCPHCGHYKVRSATWDDKKMSVAFWGIWSPKIGKGYKCDSCKRVW